MTPVLESRPVVTLEQRAASLRVRYVGLEKLGREFAIELLDAYLDFTLKNGLNSGFYSWCRNEFGAPRATAHRYLQVGIAVRAGHEGSILELEAAGRGKAAGMTDGEVTTALSDGSIRDKAEARANAGLVKIPVPEWGRSLERELVQRFPNVNEPELVGLAIQFAHEQHEQFTAFIGREA